jgi:sulfonate transport system permease protein
MRQPLRASSSPARPGHDAPPLEVVVGARPPRDRGLVARAWGRAWRSPWVRLVGPLALLAVWQLATTLGDVSPTVLTPPSRVADTAWGLIRDGSLPDALAVSLRRVAIGVLLGVVVGSAVALIAGLSRTGERLVDPAMHMFRTMPALALVPLFILWFGIGETPKVLLVALAVVFPIYLNLYAGIRGVDARLIEAGRVFGLGRWGLVRDVVLPGALASWLVGLRYALGIAWIVLVASEQINASSGIGFLMTNAQNLLQTDVILVGLLVYSLLGVGTDVLVRLAERRALSWRRGLEAR